MRWLIFLAVILLVGCEDIDISQLSDEDIERISDKVIVCEEPYMRFASGCCLDANGNKVCDADEPEGSAEELPEEDTPEELIPPELPAVWQDVYSRALYQSIIGETPDFKAEGNNIYYAEKLSVDDYIIIDDPYDAVSVAPYAVMTGAYVLFEDNKDFLDGKEVHSLLLYGDIDLDSLSVYDPAIINEGDRYSNNIELAYEFERLGQLTQVYLTSGRFLEKGLMSGQYPVILIGEDVPEIVEEYISESDIEVGVLIGNDLVGAATRLRQKTGISVFVKFAQGSRASPLDIYELH